MPPLSAASLDFADRLQHAGSLDASWRELLRTIRDIGFESVLYGFAPAPHPNTPISQEFMYLSTHPAGFLARYDEAGHMDHDLAVMHCFVSEEPLRWRDQRYLDRATPRQMQVIDEAWDFGIQNGVSLPLRDGNPLSIGGIGINAGTMPAREFEAIWRHRLDDVIQIATLFHGVVTSAGLFGERVRLSPREQECLLWCAAGLRADEIAGKLGLTSATVRFHLGNAARKLRARNATHAVSKAMALRILHI